MYHQEITQYTRLPIEQENAIAELARQGDRQARHNFITLLVRNLEQFVARYYATYFLDTARIEYQELIAVGNLALVEKLDQALATDHPVPYLLTSAYGVIRSHCRTHQSLITTPDSMEAPPLTIVSMNAPFAGDDSQTLADTLAAPAVAQASEPATDYTALHQAVEALPPRQRTVILRHYGLHALAPQALCEIKRDVYGTTSTNVDQHKKRGLTTLRYHLALTYPQYAAHEVSRQEQRLAEAYSVLQASGQPITVDRLRTLTKADANLARLYLTQREGSPTQRNQQRAYQRLNQAYAHLQATGQRISVRSLAREARVNTSAISAYLKQIDGAASLCNGGDAA